MTMHWFEYTSNNSGGSFWLSDEEWVRLHDAGAILFEFDMDNNYEAVRIDPRSGKRNMWGDIATKCLIPAIDYDGAIKFFEEHTDQDYNEMGCECCGAPHNIYPWYAEEDGEDIWRLVHEAQHG